MQLRNIQTILFMILNIVCYSQSLMHVNTKGGRVDLSSYSVSWSNDGTTLAIGVHNANDKGLKSGHVRVYKNNSGVWRQVGIDINGERAGESSGYSVSLSNDGSVLAIGAIHSYDNNGLKPGHVRVYKNDFGVWKQIGNDIDGESHGDWAGYSVSLSGDGTTVAIGAILNSDNGTDSGHVIVYKSISGMWTQIGQNIGGNGVKDYFGASVSLSQDGNIVAIGAHRGGGEGGYVGVYKNVLGNWEQIGYDIVGERSDDFSGWSVSLSNDGSIVVIGAYKKNDKDLRYCYVRAYQNKFDFWKQRGTDIGGRIGGYDLNFNNISISDNNIITLIGASETSRNYNPQIPAINYVGIYGYKKTSNIWAQLSEKI